MGLERTFRLSRYVSRVANARPGVLEDLRTRAGAPFSRLEMRKALEGDPAGLGSRLRRLRERVMVTLAHRDLNDLAPLDEVFATMTALADESIGAAVASTGMALTVAGLGKLGGEELNVSSDVDLVFLHHDDPSDAERYVEAGRQVIALLSL